VALSAARQVSKDRCQDPLRSRNLETGKAGLGREWAGGVIPARPKGIFSSCEYENHHCCALLRNQIFGWSKPTRSSVSSLQEPLGRKVNGAGDGWQGMNLTRWTQEPAELVRYCRTFVDEFHRGFRDPKSPAEVSNFVAQLSLGGLCPRIFTV
jgi:hypothetical protein